MDIKLKNDIYIGLLGQSYVEGISNRAELDRNVYGATGMLIGTLQDMIMMPDKCGDANKYADILIAGAEDSHIVVPFGLIHEDMQGHLVVYDLDKSEINSLPTFAGSEISTELFTRTEERIFSIFDKKGTWQKLTEAGEYARRRTERSRVILSLNKTLLERTAEISRSSLANVQRSLNERNAVRKNSNSDSSYQSENQSHYDTSAQRNEVATGRNISQSKSYIDAYHAHDISDLPLLVAPVGSKWGVILKGEKQGGMAFDSYDDALQFAREAAMKISADIHVLNDKGEFLEKISVF